MQRPVCHFEAACLSVCLLCPAYRVRSGHRKARQSMPRQSRKARQGNWDPIPNFWLESSCLLLCIPGVIDFALYIEILLVGPVIKAAFSNTIAFGRWCNKSHIAENVLFVRIHFVVFLLSTLIRAYLVSVRPRVRHSVSQSVLCPLHWGVYWCLSHSLINSSFYQPGHENHKTSCMYCIPHPFSC